jgi:hypothetical protein
MTHMGKGLGLPLSPPDQGTQHTHQLVHPGDSMGPTRLVTQGRARVIITVNPCSQVTHNDQNKAHRPHRDLCTLGMRWDLLDWSLKDEESPITTLNSFKQITQHDRTKHTTHPPTCAPWAVHTSGPARLVTRERGSPVTTLTPISQVNDDDRTKHSAHTPICAPLGT